MMSTVVSLRPIGQDATDVDSSPIIGPSRLLVLLPSVLVLNRHEDGKRGIQTSALLPSAVIQAQPRMCGETAFKPALCFVCFAVGKSLA